MTRLYGVDATLRWKPLRRSIYHSFVGRSELIWSRREQPTACRAPRASTSLPTTSSRGAGSPASRSTARTAPQRAAARQRGVGILTYWPSEFSQVRGQYRRTDYAIGPAANEFLFQVQFSIGAHGAHPF